jgi:two-component system OmpR family sensor kinase
VAPRLGSVLRRSVTAQAAIAVLIVTLTVTLVALAQRDANRADTTRGTLIALERLRGDVLSAETSLRGFALTERPAFLAPFRTAAPRVVRATEQIAARLDGDERAAALAIGRRFTTWRATFAEPVLTRLRAGRDAAARALLQSGRGKVQTDAIRAQIRALASRERSILAREQDRADRIGVIGIGAVGALSVVAVLTALVLRRRLQRDVVGPVQELAAATERFGAGDHTARAPIDGVHEVRVTARAFNEMAAEIGRTVDDLRSLDELKSRFVSMVSHELRTPLTSIKGFADELDEDAAALSESQREAVDVIVRNAGHLEAIIDDLLLLSSLESGRVELRREDVPAGRARSVALDLEAPAGLTVDADRARLRQACANLVSNAIKFSPADGTVTIRARAAGPEVRIEVADQGPGIPADELPRLTERFFRASTAAGTAGTGLGLTITGELVQRHGGRLEIESVEGEGATFRIVLPGGAAQPDGGL